MDNITNSLRDKMYDIFREMGLEEVDFNGLKFFRRKNKYYTISYITGIHSLVIECAEGIEEVKKNRLDDADLYPIKMGEEELLKAFKEDLVKYYMD